MAELTLEWLENGQKRTKTISDKQKTKQAGVVRLGRDPRQCDILFQDLTVSKIHVEIFFHPQQQQFCLRNLRDSNPPFVDGNKVTKGIVPLQPGAKIYLGQLPLKVISVVIEPPKPEVELHSSPLAAKQNVLSGKSYMLSCPHCGRACPYEWINVGCKWCGTSLAGAQTIVNL
ncbi:MAG: FHA domain-containing protein [Cyanobacteria bacterium J083]|nr:MAG: FHA domain-containing protein [Cyanobacteria bacterium J083]